MINLQSVHVDVVIIIQVYMPTLTDDDDEVEELYEQTENILEESKNTSTIVMGDFNAEKVNINEYIGKHGLGNWRCKSEEIYQREQIGGMQHNFQNPKEEVILIGNSR